MGGFFGTVAKASCVADLFYGTDYNSHLGTKRGGLATYDQDEAVFTRSIHNLESNSASISSRFTILATVTMAKRPRWELMMMGCGSVSLMIPIPTFPLNLSSSSSNLVRK